MDCEMNYMQCVSVVFSIGVTLKWQRSNHVSKYPNYSNQTSKKTSEIVWNGWSVEVVNLNKTVILVDLNWKTIGVSGQLQPNPMNNNIQEHAQWSSQGSNPLPFTILRF